MANLRSVTAAALGKLPRGPLSGSGFDPASGYHRQHRAISRHVHDACGRDVCPRTASAQARLRSLLATLVGAGDEEAGLRSATRILDTFGSINALFGASAEEIDQVSEGSGELLLAARDLAREAQRQVFVGSTVDPLDPALHGYLIEIMGGLAEEQFRAIFIDARGGYIADEEISSGSGEALTIRCRQLFRRAFALDARAAILAHNHPSEVLHPSAADLRATRQLVEFGVFNGLRILDHLIVGRRTILSMRRSGAL